MGNKTYKREKWEKAAIEMLWENRQLRNFIARSCECNTERIKVLKNILSQVETGWTRQLKDDIYLYGSMIRQQDLIARQMFLWLLALVEEVEQTELR